VTESRSSWPDPRLDQLERRVGEIDHRSYSSAQEVIAIGGRINNLGQELRKEIEDVQYELGPNGAVGRLSTTLAAITGEPVAERRLRREAILTLAIGSAIGALIVSGVIYLASSVH
jgi:hypothetical protein